MVVDDGHPGRGHQDNLLSTDFTHSGVSCGCHEKHGDVCCIMYGKDVRPKTGVQAKDVLRVKQDECERSESI